MVVLAVNIGSDSTTHCHETRSGRDGNKKATRHNDLQKIMQTHTRSSRHCASVSIKDRLVGITGHRENYSASILCRISVRPAKTAHQDASPV
jgi:hypothetical protein